MFPWSLKAAASDGARQTSLGRLSYRREATIKKALMSASATLVCVGGTGGRRRWLTGQPSQMNPVHELDFTGGDTLSRILVPNHVRLRRASPAHLLSTESYWKPLSSCNTGETCWLLSTYVRLLYHNRCDSWLKCCWIVLVPFSPSEKFCLYFSLLSQYWASDTLSERKKTHIVNSKATQK